MQQEVKSKLNELVIFKFELPNVSKLGRGLHAGWKSGRFQFRGAEWTLGVKYQQLEYVSNSGHTHSGTDAQLSIRLSCHNDYSVGWSCETNLKFILYHTTTESQNLSIDCNHTFRSRRDFCYPNFISYSRLVNPDNGYVYNDQVVLAVHLRVEPIVQTIE